MNGAKTHMGGGKGWGDSACAPIGMRGVFPLLQEFVQLALTVVARRVLGQRGK